MMLKRKCKTLLAVLMSALMMFNMAGCSDKQADEQGVETKEKKKITFCDPGWDTTSYFSGIARFIIENGYGYGTEMQNGSDAILFTALKEGDVDIHMEIWKDGYAPYNEAAANGEVEYVGTIHSDAKQGYYVPTFVIEGDAERGIEPMAPDLKTVKDLEKYWEVFQDAEDKSKGRLYSSPVGWLADEITHAKVESYGLDKNYNVFNPGSQSALEASLSKACEQGKPWVGYYWEPTWIAGQYDLTLLEDEPYSEDIYAQGKCEYPKDSVIIISRKGFAEDAPDVYEFLKTFEMSGDMVSETLAYIQDSGASSEEAAMRFIKEREDLWSTWVPQEVAERVKAAAK